MRILVLIHEYPPIGGGGGRVAQDVARGLVRLGHKVYVLAPYMSGLPRYSSDEGVDLIRIPSLRRKAFVGDILAMSGYLLGGFFASLWLIVRVRPQIIHVHFAVPAGFLAWVLFKLTGVPYVLTSHLGDIPGGVPEKTERWFRWIYPFTHRIWRDAAVVTAVSDFTRRLAIHHYPINIKVIPNGIEVDLANNERKHLNKPCQIIFVGRFVPQKNPELVPKVLQALQDLDWHCIMIGDGPARHETMLQISLLGLAERFTLPGWISQKDVNDILWHSDILFLPSNVEGIPLAGLQSLATGLAIVASQVGGVIELVENGVNGFLHEPGDVIGFARSLRKFLTDSELLTRAKEASKIISHKFALQNILREYEKVFSGIIERR